MSTQTKYKIKIGDEVRVTNFKNQDDGHDYSGDPKGMIGRVLHVEDHYAAFQWPYRVRLEGRAPELFYPDYFAEDELELVETPSPELPGIVTTEWGVRSPWGDNAAFDAETARNIADNMRDSGHEAVVIWRGITEWQVKA